MSRAAARLSRLVLASLLGAACAHVSAQPADREEWRFTVYLDDKPIGEHSFVRRRQGDEEHVEIRARFDVTLLRIPVYRYEHDNREVWREGCLARIEARTRDNGKALFVRGSLQDGALGIETARGGAKLPGCVSTFAYWDPAFLSADRLLNAQTGDYVPIEVTRHPQEPLRIGSRQVPAERRTLRAGDLHIDLWYSTTGEWLALASTTKGGRVLRYEKQI